MWMMVMFDLPVTTDAERKAATAFRGALLDDGLGYIYAPSVRLDGVS